MTLRILSLTLALAALGGAGCAKDRTVDDYKRGKVAERLAQIEAVSGTYRGTLSDMGAVSLKIERGTRVNPSSNIASTEAQATLQGEVRVESGDQVWLLPFNDGYYDPTSGDFRADVAVDQRNGQSARVGVWGTFSDGRVSGRIEAERFGEKGASFDLVRNGPLPSPQSLLGAAEGRTAFGALRFRSLAEFTHTPPTPVTLALVATSLTSDQEFYDLFTPVKWVDVTVTRNDSPVTFAFAQWDQRRGKLYGRVQGEAGSPRVAYGLTLDCRQTAATATEPAGWDCAYSSDQDGPLFHGVFKPVN